jgi:hypothetical protein
MSNSFVMYAVNSAWEIVPTCVASSRESGDVAAADADVLFRVDNACLLLVEHQKYQID